MLMEELDKLCYMAESCVMCSAQQWTMEISEILTLFPGQSGNRKEAILTVTGQNKQNPNKKNPRCCKIRPEDYPHWVSRNWEVIQGMFNPSAVRC